MMEHIRESKWLNILMSVLLAVLAAISVVLLAWVLWRLLRIISRRRLNPDNE